LQLTRRSKNALKNYAKWPDMEIDILDKFSTNLKEVLSRALEQAILNNEEHVEPVSLINSMIHQKGSVAHEVLGKLKLKPMPQKKNIASESPGETTTKSKNLTPTLSPQSKRAIEKAVLSASLFPSAYVGTEHLLFGLLEINDKEIIAFLKKQSVDTRKLKIQIEQILKTSSKFSEITENEESGLDSAPFDPVEPDFLEGDAPPYTTRMKPVSKSKTPMLDFFATDLTSEESQKEIDPLIGRDKEVMRMMQILCRRHKNNPLLLGEPGVGKTAIVEGLAKKIVEGGVPYELADKKILALDLSLIIAGTMYRGEFESRLKQVIEEIRNNKNLIIFIDEIHNIIGAGATAGSLDAANILKPALARGELHCIGATTLDEFKKHIESDPALERRFQPIQIKEPSRDEAIKILLGIRPNYEKFHNIRITREAIETAVDTSIRYLTDRFLPDKAIDLIDEAASGIKILSPPKKSVSKLKDMEKELDSISDLKQRAVFDERYNEAIELKAKERSLEKAITSLKKGIQKEDVVGVLRAKDIHDIISKHLGISVKDIAREKSKSFSDLKNVLNKSIIGQERVIDELIATLTAAKTGLREDDRPLASFLFLGSSGVGKTELARTLAQYIYPTSDSLVQIDMSEFKETYSTSKLLGSPAGYIGYKERNKFTDEVRKKPYAIVLFDELEKAHPDVQNLLLQILEQGIITDATGKKINFKNTIIIMTSNLGFDLASPKIGFGGKEALAQEMPKELESKLKEQFKSELLNRIDKILYFNGIDGPAIKKIISLELEKIAKNAQKKGLDINFLPKAIDALSKKSLAPEEGARAVRKTIQNHVENPLSEMIINGKILKEDLIEISYEKGKFCITKKQPPHGGISQKAGKSKKTRG